MGRLFQGRQINAIGIYGLLVLFGFVALEQVLNLGNKIFDGTPAIFYSPEISSGITSNPTAMDTSLLMEDGGSSVAENTDIPEPVQKAVEMLLNGEAISGYPGLIGLHLEGL